LKGWYVMEATKNLMDEHRVIERVLAAMEKAVEALGTGRSIKPEFFLAVADFNKGFADGCHHVKEEKVLFEAMVKAGVPKAGGPVGMMLLEHEQGRALVRAICAGVEKWQSGDNEGRSEVIKATNGYIDLLRAHIYKEDKILFPLADDAILWDAQEQIAKDLERIEREETGEGVHEKYLALVEKLERAV
jgi:hemerythrin-like domain-containing protein